MMRNSLALVRKIIAFTCTKRSDRLMLMEAFVLTGIYRTMIFLLPFSKYKRHIGIHNMETPFQIGTKEYAVVKKVSWAVETVSRYTPWKSKCFVQALAAQRMLKRRDIDSTMYLGVSRNGDDGMKAHAWLRCGNVYVTGGNGSREFTEVARFASRRF